METLNKTWFIDIDGTFIKHLSNMTLDELMALQDSYKLEEPLKDSVQFMNNIPEKDTIVITTARESRHKEHTLKMLEHFNIRYDKILFDLRSGPRVLVNDIKPVGVVGNESPVKTAYAINVERDRGISIDHHENILHLMEG